MDELTCEAAIRRVLDSDLFPLALAPFEKFVMWDESKSHPMSLFVELHFNSELDHDKLTHAMSFAVHQHPLLACRVKTEAGQLSWVYDPDYRPLLNNDPEQWILQSGRPHPFNLAIECGSRYWLKPTSEGCRLVIQIHHACCDGIGMRQFLLDLLVAYAHRCGDHRSPIAWKRTLRGPELPRLGERADFRSLREKPPTLQVSGWQKLKNAHYFHFLLPKAILNSDAAGPSKEPNDAPLRHLLLDTEISQQIFDKARRDDIGLNDLALALLFHTCMQWNRQRGDSNPKSRLRLLMPFDLRTRGDLKMPAANRLSFAFLGRTYRECEDLQSLVASVKQEVQDIKDSKLPLDFIDALQLGSSKPKLFRWLLKKSHRMSTAILTYGGDISRRVQSVFEAREGEQWSIGDSALSRVLAAPPVRRNSNIAIGLCINWGQICMSAAWNRDVLTAKECDEFLRQFQKTWQHWLATP